MDSLKDRLQEMMRTMDWEHADVVRVSKQSSSVVSQWLGKSKKEIKTIGKLEAAIYLERATDYSALWLAKGMGPKRVARAAAPSAGALIASEPAGPAYGAAQVLDQLAALLKDVPPAMLESLGDIIGPWAAAGGTDTGRRDTLLHLLAAGKQRRRA